MQLAKLVLAGFKSFADRTEFTFEPGVTALIGPNGCGKSNVVDAFRWILGSQSPKALRGSGMTDVIFGGTETRRGAGYAEASITILNTKGLLPTEYQEVCITRRLYRTGESEYFINRQPCRLKDIRRLLFDTGIGVDSYSLIEQGKVDRILDANPVERRLLFDEAAGISGFKQQKKEANAKLERACANIERINDIISEKERQLRSVKYQASKARRHRELTDRLTDLSVSHARREYARMTRLRRQYAARIAELQEELRRWNQEIAGFEQQQDDLGRELGELDARISGKETRLHRAETDRRAAEERVRTNSLRIQELETAANEASERVGALLERRQRGAEQYRQALAELDEVRAAVEEQTESVNAQVEAVQQSAAERQRLDRAIEDWKARVLDILQRAAALRNEMGHLEGSRNQELGRRGRLCVREEELNGRIDALTGQIETATAELATTAEQLEAGRGEYQVREGALAESRARLEEVAAELDRVQTEWTALSARREILIEMEEKSEGLADGVKTLMEKDADGTERVAGLRGLVADLIQVDMEHAVALDAALGEKAQYVVVGETESARRALALLRQASAGRAGVLALDRLVPAQSDGLALMGRPGVVGRALDFVRCRPDMLVVARSLLNDTIIVETFEDALSLARTGEPRMRFVTLAGEVVEPGAAIVVGSGRGHYGLVSRRSEMADITGRLDELEEQLCGLRERRDVLRARMETLRRRVEEKGEEVVRLERRAAHLEGNSAHLGRQCDRMEEERQVVRSEVQEIDGNVRSYIDREAAIRRELVEAEQRQDELHGEVEVAKVRLERQRERAEALACEVTALRVSLAQKEEKQGNLEGRVARLQTEQEETEGELRTARSQIESYRSRRQQAEEQVAADRTQILELRLQDERVRRELGELQSARDELRARQDEVTGEIRSRRGKIDGLQERLGEQRMKENEQAVRLSALEERVREDHEIELGMEPILEQDEETDWEGVREEIEKIQDTLRRLGPVNLEAIGQQEELEESINFRVQQRDDLLAAQKELKGLIQRLNGICRERFETTFEEIRKNFHDVFRRLFGGGKAEIRLEEDAEDVLEAGIEIMACPPEKDLRSISLMSGGEKTMTTIALLFAIFKAKPSPFCILDEVDAALDEANIGRFAAMLRDFLDDSQFIIITHSKRTMSVADVLYGITMEEKGVSKRVAVRLDQAVEMVA